MWYLARTRPKKRLIGCATTYLQQCTGGAGREDLKMMTQVKINHLFGFKLLRMILRGVMIVFGRFLLINHGDMERKTTWQWWCFHWKECGLYSHITRPWAPEILLDPKHGITWAVARAHTSDVESGAAALWGWGSYSDSRGRGHLLLDWTLEMGCPHLTNRFLRRGYYHTRVDRTSLYPWDKDIREENPLKSSGGWTSTECIVYYVEGGGKPRSAPGV